MEAKKNSKANLEKSRSIFFLIGMLISMTLVLAAFNYATETENVKILTGWDGILEGETTVQITRPEDKKEIILPEPKKAFNALNLVENNTKVIDDFDPIDAGAEEGDIIPPKPEIKRTVEIDDPPIFIADKMPEPPGGVIGLKKFIADHVKYPQIAKETGIEGKVYVRFCVSSSGNIERVSIARGIDPLLDNEAMRVVKILPKWKPGENGGRKVSVWYTVPIVFKLK